MSRSKRIPGEGSRFYSGVAGRVLKGIRHERNLNASDLANLCGWKNEEIILRIERGERSLEVGDFLSICEYAGFSPAEACARLIQACKYQDELDGEVIQEPEPEPVEELPPLEAKPKAKEAKPKASAAKPKMPPAPKHPVIRCG